MRKIVQIFVAFSENLNFNQPKSQIKLDKISILRDLYAMPLTIPVLKYILYQGENFCKPPKGRGGN